jgi:hypothetical protein
MLIEQHQWINGHGAQRQQLRPRHAFDGHCHSPLPDVLAQPVARLNGLRPQWVEDLAHFHAALAMGRRPAAGGDPLPPHRWHSWRPAGVLSWVSPRPSCPAAGRGAHNQGAPALSPRFATVNAAATGLHTVLTVTARGRVQPYHQPCQPDWRHPAAVSIEL